jgi:hypothetical protein
MDSDENKERTTPGEREEIRPTGSGENERKGAQAVRIVVRRERSAWGVAVR